MPPWARPWNLQLGPDPSWKYPLQPVRCVPGGKKTRYRGRAYAAGALVAYKIGKAGSSLREVLLLVRVFNV